MATERQRELLLGVLLVILAIVGYRAWRAASPSQVAPDTSGTVAQATNPPGPSESAPAPASRGTTAPRSPAGTPAATTAGGTASQFDVHLESLDQERPKPGAAERNLFRFKPPPVRPAPARPVIVAPPPVERPAGPPPPPPIALKFIGIVESTNIGKPIAILSDGSGVPLYGREGEVVAGQFRILKIGVESIEMSYLDGRGRQIIRLTGS